MCIRDSSIIITILSSFSVIYVGGNMPLLQMNSYLAVSYTHLLLQKSGHKFEFPVEWGCDLQTEHERYLTEEIIKGPVFVTDYPKDIKAFYCLLYTYRCV